MSVTELVLLITTVTSAIVAIINTRTNATAIDELKDELEDAHKQQKNARRDIILIGEQLAVTRQDSAALVILVNQLFNQYEQATGKKPDVNWEMFDQMRTIQYITGPLGPLNVE